MNGHVGSLKHLAQQLVREIDRGACQQVEAVVTAAENERLMGYLEHHLDADLGTLQKGRAREIMDQAFARWAHGAGPEELGLVEDEREQDPDNLHASHINGLALVLMWLLEILTAPQRDGRNRKEPWEKDPDSWKD